MVPIARRAEDPWSSPWFDAIAFLAGLGLAWSQRWNTTDLVWSLWLSSLVVGYAMIVWQVSGPLRDVAAGVVQDPDHSPGAVGGKLAVIGILGAGTLLGLAFFTFHFGFFHYVHSAF